MDNKELQRAVNPVYLTAKGTLGLLKRAEDPDAVALLPLIGLDADLQEKAKVLPAPIGLCYKTAQLARYEIYNTAAIRSSAPNIVDLPGGIAPDRFNRIGLGKNALYLIGRAPCTVDYAEVCKRQELL